MRQRLGSIGTRRFASTCLGFGALFFVLVAVFSRLYVYGVDGPVSNPTDFRAFYCGGAALVSGENPYRVEPLRTCERSSLSLSGLRMDENHLLTAPFPPYALLAFGALSKLPFRLATECWLALNLIALGLAVVGGARLSGLRPTIVALALSASAGYASLVIGQLVPIVLAALVYAALCARRGNGAGAALGVTIASLEPHLALPAWCALALFVPSSRVPLGVAAAALCTLSLVAGPALDVEYLTQTLPQHARSEVYNFGAQYSLSSLLAAAGVPVTAALRLGSLSYGCALAAGLWLGRALARRYQDAAFLIAAPTAAVLLGGPFVHGHQMAAALPFALMLLAVLPPRKPLYVVTFAAVCALAVPWESIAESALVADRVPLSAPQQRALPPLPRAAANEPAEKPYTAFMDASAARSDPRSTFEQIPKKLPTWYGLIALLAAASVLARETPRRPAL